MKKAVFQKRFNQVMKKFEQGKLKTHFGNKILKRKEAVILALEWARKGEGNVSKEKSQ